jgi:hypothetical protein
MTAYTKNMRQTATYWPPEDNDGFGGRVLGYPRTIQCRWQDTTDLFRDAEGREAVGTAIVYPAEELQLRGYLALGDHTDVSDPKDLAEAYEVRRVQQSPSLAATEVLHKVFL